MYGDSDKCKGNFLLTNEGKKFYIIKWHSLPQWEIQFYSLPPYSQEKPWDILFLFWNRIQCFISSEFYAQRKKENAGIKI